MVQIEPFRGFRYNKEIVQDYASVIAPPYDVIDADLQKMLHERSDYNISRLTKGVKFPNDNERNNQYTRAADLLGSWLTGNILVQEERPTIYVLAQEFKLGTGEQQSKLTRVGFIALLKLEDFCSGGQKQGDEICIGVHQHEETLPKDIEDRLNLCRTTLSNFGQIFAIYPDHELKTETLLEDVMSGEPVMVAQDDEGVTHKLWLMQDVRQINELKSILADKSMIIADGHHRYKTALKLHEEHNDTDDPVNVSSGYRMISFVNMLNKGLMILPTHRLVQKIEDFNSEVLLSELEQNFTINKYPISDGDDCSARDMMFSGMKAAFEGGKQAFGLYCNTGQYYLLTLKEITPMDKVQDRSAAWRRLDVSILHQLILDDLLGIDKEKLETGTITGGAYVEYIKDIGDAVQKAIDKVNNSDYQALFFMNPTRASEVESVATNHETMPQKSTFFYPKIYTGYVINKL
jgi:uncharacterized protein (DUF1015 family)